MKIKSIVRAAAAAAVSLMMSVSGGIAASAHTSAEIYSRAEVCGYSASSVYGTDFSIPTGKVTVPYGGSYLITPAFSEGIPVGITYSSSDESIASVDQNGLVTAVSSGKCVITLDAENGSSVELNVTVAEEGRTSFATKLFFNYDTHTMVVGDVWRAPASVGPKNCEYTVRYSSSDKSVAAVQKTGDVTAVGVGTCTIQICSDNGLVDTMEINVIDPMDAESLESDAEGDRIEFADSSIALDIGQKYRPAVNVYPEGSEYTLKYKSSDTSVVKVSSKGTLLGVSRGNADIIVYCGDLYDIINVTVGEAEENIEEADIQEYDAEGNPLPKRIEFTYNSDLLMIGEKFSTGLKVYPKGSVYTISYSSSDESVAIVSSKGTVKGVGVGTAIITATTSNGKTDSFIVTVYNECFKGIDVSKWNGDVDWETISKNPDVNFVMIRASYGQEDEDIRFKQNVEGCERYGIDYGFYHYMYADTVEDAVAEADFFLNTIKGTHPTYPVVLDIEESFYQRMDKETVTDIVCTFMDKLESAGYYAMIYSYASFFDDNLIIDRVSKYDYWVACWGDKDRLNEKFSYPYGMWQYSETGRIEGCNEDVDLNYSYKNYPYIIKKYGLNNSYSIYDNGVTIE